MEKRIKLDNGNEIILARTPGYCCDTISIYEGYLKEDDLEKQIELHIWDDISFNAYTKDRGIRTIDFDIDINHPLYFCIKHLLNEDNELIIDDDNAYESLKRYLLIRKEEDIYKFIFVNNLEKIEYRPESFRVFIKNIGSDCRSKISDVYVKYRIVDFFREVEKTLLEENHQIILEEYLEFNKVKKRMKSR